ncbi:MAG: AMP-binding protein [Pseudomonadota bacterium]
MSRLNDTVTEPTRPLTALLIDGLRASDAPVLIDRDGPVARPEFAGWVAAQLTALRGHGLEAGARVALHGTASPALIATLVACLLQGLVIVPVDADLPAARKQLILELSSPVLILDFSQGGLDVPVPAGARRVTAGPPPASTLALADIDLPEISRDAGCYVFFTSGTTGRPKGVLGRRGGLAHFLQWEARTLALVPGDRVSLLTRLSFDVVLRDLLLPIVAGVTGCIPRNGLGAHEVPQWLAEAQVTVSHVVPSLAQAWLAAPGAHGPNTRLRHTLFAGEPLSGALVARWREAFPNSAVHNLYGPTETTLAKFWARVPDPAPDGIQCCGRPLPETDVLIVDERRNPVAANQLGEVAIQTVHRSLGYLDPNEPTAANFTAIGGVPSYLSGDLGFLDDAGQLHLRGRKDDQIKILGVRIEPVGVAAVLQSHPEVEHAAVVCLSHPDGSPYLAGYFTTRGDAAALRRSLRPFMAERLPAAAVPSHFIALDALPTTPNGKLDRARLPQPAPDPQGGGEAPADALEQAVVDAMAKALGRETVGVHDDFFALGGDSLIAGRLSAALKDSAGLHLVPAALLSAPSARDIAAHLRSAGAAAPAPIPDAPRAFVFPLTPQQKRYFRTFCAGGNRNWCNMVAVFDLPDGTGSYDVRRALTEIGLRHQSLRLRFHPDDHGGVLQSIDPATDFAVPLLDLSGVPQAELAGRVEALRIAEAETEIPVFRDGPLFRAAVLALPQGRRKLLWNVHHLVSDGTSQGLLAAELGARLRGERPSPAPTPFRDIAAWAQRPADSLHASRDYFRNLLTPLYAHGYLQQRVECGDPQRCHAFEAVLPDAVRDAVRTAARQFRCTPYVLFVSAYFRLVAALTGQEDVAIVTPLAGRAHPQIAPVIGDFINLVPMRLRELPSLGAPQLLAAVKEQIAAAASHQAWQFDEVLDDLDIPFDPDRNPLTGFSLNFMPQDSAAQLVQRHADRGYKLKYDVLFLVRDFTNATQVEIQYRAGVWAHADVEAAFAVFCRQLEELSHV